MSPSRPPRRSSRRLDAEIVERGLAESRAMAQRLILAGEVRVDGEIAARASQIVSPDARVEVLRPPPYVSRGGEKLEAALDAFGLDVSGKLCADVGASTGGFTDCLLQRGAARVLAIDVGHGILHWKLRQDPRVTLLERTNVRYLEDLGVSIHFASIDVAFISLRLVLPVVARWLGPGGDLVALVKPQFEAGRGAVGKGGVVRDASVHRQVLLGVLAASRENELAPQGVIRSPLRGPKGNIEFLMWSKKGAAEPGSLDGAMEAALQAS